MRKVPSGRSAPGDAPATSPDSSPENSPTQTPRVPEIGGAKGPEPTRYGDWEHNGRCTDF
jgi:hypothetical protein